MGFQARSRLRKTLLEVGPGSIWRSVAVYAEQGILPWQQAEKPNPGFRGRSAFELFRETKVVDLCRRQFLGGRPFDCERRGRHSLPKELARWWNSLDTFDQALVRKGFLQLGRLH